MCVERCRWNKVCPGVSTDVRHLGGNHIPICLHPDSGVGKDLLDLKEEKKASRVWWSWYSGVPAYPVGGEELGRMERMEGQRKCCDQKGVLGKWPNTAAWT